MYEYTDDEIEKLDKMLDFFNMMSVGSFKNEQDVFEMMDGSLGVKFYQTAELLDTIEKHGLIGLRDQDNSTNRRIVLRAKGKKFIEDGGFKADKERHQEIEKERKQQAEFWKSSTSRNKKQERHFLWIRYMTIFNIILLVINVVLTFYRFK